MHSTSFRQCSSGSMNSSDVESHSAAISSLGLLSQTHNSRFFSLTSADNSFTVGSTIPRSSTLQKKFGQGLSSKTSHLAVLRAKIGGVCCRRVCCLKPVSLPISPLRKVPTRWLERFLRRSRILTTSFFWKPVCGNFQIISAGGIGCPRPHII